MATSPILSYLNDLLPTASQPWVTACLMQDPAVRKAASPLLFIQDEPPNQSAPVELTAEEWTPAAIGLRLVAPSLSPTILRQYPIADVPDDIKKYALLISSNTPIPSDDWTLEKATWIALAIRSEYCSKGSWKQVLDIWFRDVQSQHGTILACLFGMLPNPSDVLRTIIFSNPSSLNIALAIHALLANPLSTDEYLQQLITITTGAQNENDISLSSRLVALHILQSQRPQLAFLLAKHWLDTTPEFPSKADWHVQDPLTWFFELQTELFHALTSQIITLEPDSVNVIQEWKKSSLSLISDHLALSDLADLMDTARKSHAKDPEQALHTLKKAGQYFLEILANIPHLLLADSRLLPILQEISELYLAMNRPTNAVQILTQACELQPANPTLLILKANAERKANKIATAIQSLSIAAALSPSRLDISTNLAECLEQASRWSVAVMLRQALYDEVKDSQKTDVTRELLALANSTLKAQYTDQALVITRQLLVDRPQDCIAHYYHGAALLLAGKSEEALHSFMKARDYDITQPLPWLGLAEYYLSINDEEQAITTLQTAAQAATGNLEMYVRLGKIHLSNEAFTQAQEALSLAYQIAPSDPMIADLYASSLRKLGHFEKANNILGQALIENPEDQSLAFSYAETLLKLDRDVEALPYLESILSNGPINQIEPYIAYAQTLLSLSEKGIRRDNKSEKAIDALHQAIRIDPGNLHAQTLLAEALANGKRFTEALDAYQALLGSDLVKDPVWSSRLAVGMARTALALNQPEVAIAALQDVIQADPHSSLPYRLLAESYMAAQLPENALRAAQSALSLPDNDYLTATWIVTFLKNLLSQSASGSSKPISINILSQILDDSIATCQKIILARPEQVGVLISLGELQLLSGDPDAARKAYASIETSDSARPEDLERAASHLFSLNDEKAGIRCLQHAVDLEMVNSGKPPVSMLSQLAQAYLRSGSAQMAQRTYDLAIQAYPDDPGLYTAKARMFIESQQPHDALACMQYAAINIPNGHNHPDIHYTFALAHLADNDLLGAFDHARQAVEAAGQNSSRYLDQANQAESSAGHLTELYTLTAELAKGLLQPELALKYLAEWRESLTPAMQGQIDYVSAFCLYNELNLDIHGKIVQDLEFPAPALCSVGNPRLLSLNARLAYWKGDPDQAQEFLKAAMELLDTNESSEDVTKTRISDLLSVLQNYLSVAEAAIELRQWESALTYLRKAVNYTPASPVAHLSMARFYILQAEYQDLCQSCLVLRHAPGPEALSESAQRGIRTALASLRDLIDRWQNIMEGQGLHLQSIPIDRWQSRAEMIFEKPFQIALAIQKLINLNDDSTNQISLPPIDDTAALVAASRRIVGLENGNTELSRYIQTAPKKFPYPLILLQLAVTLTEENSNQALEASLLSTKYLNQDRSNLSGLAHAYQATLYKKTGMLSEALSAIEISLDIWPDEPRWHALAADIKNQLGDVSGTIAHLEEAVKNEPGNVKHHISLGWAYLRAMEMDRSSDSAIYQKRAIRNLERATRLTPQDPDVWLSLAEAYFKIDDYPQAEQCADKAIELTGDNYSALSIKANIALRLNDPIKARDYAKRAALIDPDQPTAHLLHARALESLDSPNEALQALEKALPNTDNPLPLLLEHAGLVRQLEGPQVALQELISLAQRFPDEAEVLDDLASAYMECDQDDAAIQSAQKALQTGKLDRSILKQAQLHLLLGRLLRKRGQLDQAITHLHKAALLAPDDVDPYLELGMTHKERREFSQALQLFQQATTIAQRDPRPYYLAGLALKDGKDYKQSETMLRKAASLAPQDVNIRRQLAAIVALNLVHNPGSIRVSVE